MRKLSGILVVLLFVSVNFVAAQVSKTLPHVVVYKANAKYRNLVPVQLSADKKSVVSYPGPGDIKTGSGYPLPVSLHNGYWLDRFGVDANSAYIRLTYKQYSELKEVPSTEELYKMIIAKSPMTELYDCGVKNGYNNSAKRLNDLIDGKLLRKKCKRIK